jgi:hypothetical protein
MLVHEGAGPLRVAALPDVGSVRWLGHEPDLTPEAP